MKVNDTQAPFCSQRFKFRFEEQFQLTQTTVFAHLNKYQPHSPNF